MAFPLIVRGNILGSLHFSFRRTPENLPELTEFMTEISGQVALAVDNMLTHATLLAMNAHLEQQKRYLLKDVDAQYHPDNFFFCSRGMREIMRQIEIIACSDASVLITGETGTGKDYIARYIHQLSDRRDGLCVKINCPALAASLFESELFGHAKGAFTGASTSRVGRFEMAHGGTVFLDEIGELPMALQAKLLHVLQDRRFERVGDSRPVEANFRVIAATNCDLERAIRDKSFRSDLYYRLNTVSFHIPPLRERVEEIEPLVHKLVRIQAETMHRIEPVISERAMDVLKRHTWPGNVRELKNLINRLIIIHSGKTVCAGDVEPILSIRPGETPHASPAPVPGPAPGPQPPQSGTMTLSEAERAHIARVLAMTRGAVGGKAGAAATLKMPKSTLQYKIRKYGLDPRDFVR
jgi:transcriptional regulator with GAF, ATPase, and Fis domain